MRRLLPIAVLALGCGSRVEPVDAPANDAAGSTDTAAATIPPGSTEFPVAAATCNEREEKCAGTESATLLDIFDDIRACAPSSVRDVCVFKTTFDFNANGCVTNVYLVEKPAGIDPAIGDRFSNCVRALAEKSRWSCVTGLRLLGIPACS